VDHFKSINDRLGHTVGDQVLRECGRMLQRICGRQQLPARYGGEEFAILLHASVDAAFQFAERIRREFSARSVADQPAVTLSLGVATAYEPGDAHLLFSQADEALYAAKAQGRNVTVTYADLELSSMQAGDDVEVAGLENRARVLSERVASFITLRSKRLLKHVRAEAETDELTQFYTRRYFDRRLKTDFDQVARRAGKLAVALVDLDYFGQVNKSHGWPTGDKVLREVCNIIRQHVRATDWIGRYGGEEFCIVMPFTTLQEACAVLQRMRAAVAAARLRSTSDKPVRVTLSIGVAAYDEQDAGPPSLLERASTQALAAKQAGRNCVCTEGAPV
jgi:diguanylate cyclase (GGDEF)-like protein